MKKLIRYWNQNRLKIIIMLIIIVFIIILIKTTNNMLKNRDEVITNNIVTTNTSGPTESVLTGEGLTEEQNEMLPVIDLFIEYCNQQKIDKAYELLSKECKEELYPNMEDFKLSYYDRVFDGQTKNVNIENWIKDIYRIEVNESFLSTGIYTNENTIQDYIEITNEGEEYKLNINGYIGREEINKTANYENIEITAIRSDTYMDFQTYTYKIVNNSNNNILLDDKMYNDTMCIEDQNGIKYSAYTHEMSEAELMVSPKQTKEITIKYYNKYGSTKYISKINFSRIILNYNINESKKYGNIQIEL